MEEDKKEIKISLTNLFFILMTLIIIVLIGYIYILKHTVIIEDEPVNETQEQILEEIVEPENIVEDQNTVENIVENTVNEDNENSTLDKDVDVIAIELFEKGSEKIRETEYTDYYQYPYPQVNESMWIGEDYYQKRDVLYSDVENEYAEIFTDEALKKVMDIRFLNVDDYLYVSAGGATVWTITNIKLNKISESKNEIKYEVTYSDIDAGDNILEPTTCTMTLKLVNGNYRISETNYYKLK